MKVLCVCLRGNVRSVTAAYMLKEFCNIEAVAIGYTASSFPLRRQLINWADKVLLLDSTAINGVRKEFTHPTEQNKLIDCKLSFAQSGIGFVFKPELTEPLKEKFIQLGWWTPGKHKPFTGG